MPSATLAVFAALAIAATPASATSIQTLAGQPYTGALNGALSGNAVFTSSDGNVTCNQSSFTGQITNAGTASSPGAGNIGAIDWKNMGNNACPDTITFGNAVHSDFVALLLPWNASGNWLSDNTSGTPNGTLTFSGMRFSASFGTDIGPVTCEYSGDFNNTGATTKQVQVDLRNPDNTTPGNTEMRFVSEPLELTNGGGACPATSTLTATYTLTGQGGVKLQIREKPSNAFTFGDLERNKKNGTATLIVNVPVPGELALSGNGVKPFAASQAVAAAAVTAPGPVELTIRAKGKKKKRLNENGKVKVNPTITFTPTGGIASSQTKKIKLKKND